MSHPVLISTLLIVHQTLEPGGHVSGRLLDAGHSPLVGADVVVICDHRRAEIKTVENGEFTLTGMPRERCVVVASAPGFLPARQSVDFARPEPPRLEFRLQLLPFASEVVVTASRGLAEDTSQLERAATRVDRTDLDRRPFTVVTQALREEAGVLAQQTTSAHGSPIVRGFTGQRNLYLLDGVRYNTAAWRDGPSQYLAWLPSSNIDHLEIVRGPGSAQYGSDALGATISVVSRSPRPPGGRRTAATVGLTLASANALRGSDVSVSADRSAISFQLGASFSEATNLRPGKGIDSRAAVSRFLGLSSTVVSDELRNTGFRQSSGHASLAWRLSNNAALSAQYLRASHTGVHRYDQELGGNGQFRSEFGPQQLDFGLLRYSKDRLGWLDNFSATWSVNRQSDGRLTQARPGQRIDEQTNITTALGYQAQGTRVFSPRSQATFGLDVYDEYIAGRRTLIEHSGVTSRARPEIPDGTRYTSLGAYWQHAAELVPGRLQARGGLRYGRFAFSTRRDAALGVTDDVVTTDDVTFNGGVVLTLTSRLNATFSVSRGFRAANAFDFGGIGLSGGAGFEIAPSRAIALSAERGSTDGATAVGTGRAVEPLGPEQLYAYEAGLRWHASRLSASVTAFDLESRDLIERYTLIFNRNVVGEDIAGFTIVRQDDVGRAYVAGEARPIVTRVNVSRARIRGFEAEGAAQVSAAWRARVWGSLANGRELEAGRFLRRMPPASAGATLLWQRPGSRVWIESVVQGAFEQTRLSDADFGDARIGARRSAASIAAFFNGTAVDLGLVQNGRLTATGETVPQVQSRVLAGGAEMFRSTGGYWVVGLRGGVPLTSRVDLIVIGENLTDRNYRLHGSGLDEPGVNVQARLRLRF